MTSNNMMGHRDFNRSGSITKALSILTFFVLWSAVTPSVCAEIVVHDKIALKGEEVMLTAETRGRFSRKAGELVEFFLNGKSVGKALSGGDGFAYKQLIVSKAGLHKVTVKSAGDVGSGLILALSKGTRVVFIEAEEALIVGSFLRKPRPGSREATQIISGRFPVVLLQTGISGRQALKSWLKDYGFPELPVVPWEEGAVFRELAGKGVKIRAVIGSREIIQSASQYKPLSFSFEEGEGSREVKDWEEIRKKLK